jgi:hypothetical protein
LKQQRQLDVGAKFDGLEAAGARHHQRRVDLALDEHIVARLGEMDIDLTRPAGGLQFAPLESAAQPRGRDGKADSATVEVEVVDGDDEGAAIGHGTSIKATDMFCQPRSTC